MPSNKVDLADLNAFAAVARAGGFRDGARANGSSASGISEAVRRLEAQLGVRLHQHYHAIVLEVDVRILGIHRAPRARADPHGHTAERVRHH